MFSVKSTYTPTVKYPFTIKCPSVTYLTEFIIAPLRTNLNKFQKHAFKTSVVKIQTFQYVSNHVTQWSIFKKQTCTNT